MANSNLVGKRLLYLGGIRRAGIIVERAQKLGIYVIVADYEENSPAKKIADKSILVDATDVDALVNICCEEKIDGVLTAYVDFLMPVCYQVAKRVGLPCYFTEDMIRVSTDKLAFKEMCSRYNVPTPRSYAITKSDYKRKAYELQYPVFVKPLDASGSRGANVCHDAANFISNFEQALTYSQKGEVVVEQFLTGTDILLDYLLIDGEPHLLSMTDRNICAGRPVAVNHADLQVLPSKYLKQYDEDLNCRVIRMLKQMNFKNGIIFLQGFANKGNIIFYEMGCRLGGTWPFIDAYFTGVNPIDALLSYSLTGNMLLPGLKAEISPYFKGNGVVINLLSNRPEGTIGKIHGEDYVRQLPYVVSFLQYYQEGDTFNKGKLTDVVFFNMHIVADSFGEIKSRVIDILNHIEVLDQAGNSCLCETYNIENLEVDYGENL